MYRLLFLLTCLVLCKGHIVLPIIAPVVHELPAPVLRPYINHGFAGLGVGHGYYGKPFGHHILKRSPHIVPVRKYDHIGTSSNIGAFDHVGAIGHVASIVPVAVAQPVAVSQQARVDVRTSPVVVAAPVVVKEVLPVIAPIYSKPLSSFNLGHHGLNHVGHKY